MARCDAIRIPRDAIFALSAMAIGLPVAGLPGPCRAQSQVALPRPQGGAPRPWNAAVTEASTRFALPEAWIHAVIDVESGGDPGARSAKGAMGLMQLMPATWAAVSAQERLGQDPFNLRANVLAGTAYLRAMIDRYGDLSSALAAYNAGPGRVDDWRRRGHALPAETLAYVARLSLRLGFGASASTASVTLQTVPRPVDWRASSLFGAARNQERIFAHMDRREVLHPAMPSADRPRSPGVFVTISRRSVP